MHFTFLCGACCPKNIQNVNCCVHYVYTDRISLNKVCFDFLTLSLSDLIIILFFIQNLCNSFICDMCMQLIMFYSDLLYFNWFLCLQYGIHALDTKSPNYAHGLLYAKKDHTHTTKSYKSPMASDFLSEWIVHICIVFLWIKLMTWTDGPAWLGYKMVCINVTNFSTFNQSLPIHIHHQFCFSKSINFHACFVNTNLMTMTDSDIDWWS